MKSKEEQYLADNFVFVEGLILNHRKVAFLAHYRPAMNDEIYIAQLMSWKEDGQWGLGTKSTWQGVGLTTTDATEEVVVLGRDGEISTLGPGGESSEQIEDPNAIVGPLRGIRNIGGTVFAFGMQRQVYRRNAPKEWQPINAGFPNNDPGPNEPIDERVKNQIDNLGGITAIAGKAADDLCAVGIKGEIWLYNGQRWRPVASPTNAMLYDIAVTADCYYICGQRGVLLRGDGDTWSEVEYKGREGHNLVSAAWFRDKLYLADGKKLCCLDDGELAVVEFVIDDETITPPSHQVQTNGEILISVAGQELYITEDGESWKAILN